MSNDKGIILPDAPAIPGLYFRQFRDESDFAAMVTVIEACQEYDKVDPLSSQAGIPTVAELTESFAAAENINLNQDMLIVLLADQVIGFQWLRWWTQADDTWVYYHRGRILPGWRGRGIGTSTLRWAERRIRELAQIHPTNGRAVFRANTTSHEKEYNELLLTEGYLPIHSFVELGFDDSNKLPEKMMPPGFTLKPAVPADYRKIWEANEEAFEEEWGHRRVTDVDYIKFLGNPNFNPSLWQIAWRDDEVAGVALSEITERGVGEITELSVRKHWRGEGLARALAIHALHALKRQDVKQIRIFTDADDPFGARTLYESIGFRVLTEYIRYQKHVD
jgi:mycothiol synthase